MSPPLPQSAVSNPRSISLLRALLREASYLPDSRARSYFRRYIVNRFKAYQPSRNAAPAVRAQELAGRYPRAFNRRYISIIEHRTRATQRKAQKGLNYLRRANQGELPCLMKILLFTYGRMGKRRYALLQKLLEPEAVLGEDGVVAPEGPSPLQALYHSKERFLRFFAAPQKKSDSQISIDLSDGYSKLKAVVKSQKSLAISLGRNIKTARVEAPSKNAWERPMPIKRARNIVRKWYIDTMSKLLPPLSHAEWDMLHELSRGNKWIDFVPRRTPAVELDPQPQEDGARSMAIIEIGLALDKPSKADKPGGKNRPHNITPRMMRRLYGKIFALSCKLEYDAERSRWKAIWGSLRDISPRIYGAPVDAVLFAGVDQSGRV
ncbi:uncharacterized protein BDR25DRAFT_194017, partial [Lindgomyces ingoldianus]